MTVVGVGQFEPEDRAGDRLIEKQGRAGRRDVVDLCDVGRSAGVGDAADGLRSRRQRGTPRRSTSMQLCSLFRGGNGTVVRRNGVVNRGGRANEEDTNSGGFGLEGCPGQKPIILHENQSPFLVDRIMHDDKTVRPSVGEKIGILETEQGISPGNRSIGEMVHNLTDRCIKFL